MAKECNHKFEARYNDIWTTPAAEIMSHNNCKPQYYEEAEAARKHNVSVTQLLTECSEPVVTLLTTPFQKYHTYIYDICIKCGKTIEKKGKK